MELISGYMRDEGSRHMLNALTQKTFGFDFEGWVTNGYFEDDYIPYSLVENGVMISNVSANKMRFMQNGVVKNYIQLGTVMTDENHRNQGLAAKLMQHVIKEYEDKCDGIYLFGNLSAVGFYRKMGFGITNQYMYFVKEEFCNIGKVICSLKQFSINKLLLLALPLTIIALSIFDNFFFYPHFQIFYAIFLALAEKYCNKTKIILKGAA